MPAVQGDAGQGVGTGALAGEVPSVEAGEALASSKMSSSTSSGHNLLIRGMKGN